MVMNATRRRMARTVLTCFGILATAGATARAQEWVDRFRHEEWNTRDGLPVNTVSGLLQDRRGLLWIATHDGLVRFDGSRFRVYRPSNTPGMRFGVVSRVLETADSTIWLMDKFNGLDFLRRGVMAHLGADRGWTEPTRDAQTDARGTLWLSSSHRIGVVVEHRVRVLVDSSADSLTHVAPDQRGGAWFLQRNAVRHVNAAGRVDSPGIALGAIASVVSDSVGRVWMIDQHNGVWTAAADQPPERVLCVAPTATVRGILPRASDGSAWVQTTTALTHCRLHALPARIIALPRDASLARTLWNDEPVYQVNGRLMVGGRPIRYALAPDGHEPLRDEQITQLLPDRDGSLWIGTDVHGLHRLQRTAISTIGAQDGVPGSKAWTVLPDGAGQLWIGTFGHGMALASNRGVQSLADAARVGATGALSLFNDSTMAVGTTRGDYPVAFCSTRTLRCNGGRPRATTLPHSCGRTMARSGWAPHAESCAETPRALGATSARRSSSPRDTSAPWWNHQTEPCGLARAVAACGACRALASQLLIRPLVCQPTWSRHSTSTMTSHCGSRPTDAASRVSRLGSGPGWHRAGASRRLMRRADCLTTPSSHSPRIHAAVCGWAATAA